MTRCTCHSHNGFLTARGRAVAQQSSLEGLTPLSECVSVDRSASVSALFEVEEDHVYDENHVELNQGLIHNGS